MALWQDVLEKRPVGDEWAESEAEHYLCAFSRAEDDIAPYLSTWSQGGCTHGAAHFRVVFDWFEEKLQGQVRTLGAYWEPKPSDQLRVWFAREDTWQAFGLSRPW